MIADIYIVYASNADVSFGSSDWIFENLWWLWLCGCYFMAFFFTFLAGTIMDIQARLEGYDSWVHQKKAEEKKLRKVEREKEREKERIESHRLTNNRKKLPNLQEELEPYAKLLLPSLTEFKIDPVDEILSISYPVGKRTRKLYYHQVFTRNSESIKQAIAKDYGQESQYIREMERKEAERKISGRSCQAATGSWGTGSCLNYAKRICPRCQNFVCNAHTSNSYYGGNQICTTCARVLSDV